PNIDFGATPFYVQTELTEWKSSAGRPRRVGVSSFGAGGSNAHLILEECAAALEPESASQATMSLEAFVLSVRDEYVLRCYAEKVVEYLENISGVSLANVAYTSQVGRTPMSARLVIIAASLDELRDKLSKWAHLRNQSIDPVSNAYQLEDVFYGNIKKTDYSANSLIEGRAGKAFLQELLSNRDLAKIAQLWILGAEIDWSLMRRPTVPRRVSLPTYPFAKERLWINQQRPRGGSPTVREGVNSMSTPSLTVGLPPRRLDTRTAPALEGSEEKRRVYYSLQWTLKALAAPEERPPATGPILMLDVSNGLAEALKEQMENRSAGSPIVLVKPGKTFQEIEPNVYVI